MVIVIDFDYTLFNTHALREAMVGALAKLGVTQAAFQETERALRTQQLYDPVAHMRLLVPDHQHEAIACVQSVLQRSTAFVYPDARVFLQRHRNDHLVILSLGNRAWQEQKITASKLSALVRDVVITDASKEQIFAQWRDENMVVMVNDRGSEIDAFKKFRNDGKGVWVRRPGTPYIDEPCYDADIWTPHLDIDLHSLL